MRWHGRAPGWRASLVTSRAAGKAPAGLPACQIRDSQPAADRPRCFESRPRACARAHRPPAASHWPPRLARCLRQLDDAGHPSPRVSLRRRCAPPRRVRSHRPKRQSTQAAAPRPLPAREPQRRLHHHHRCAAPVCTPATALTGGLAHADVKTRLTGAPPRSSSSSYILLQPFSTGFLVLLRGQTLSGMIRSAQLQPPSICYWHNIDRN